MPKTTYYALLLEGDNLSFPSGLARRRIDNTGGFTDESLKRDRTWGYTPVLASAERGDLTFDIVEISEEEANRIVEQFRAKWRAEG